MFCFVFFKQKTAYEMRISDWSSDVCSSDLSPTPTATPGKSRTIPSGRWAKTVVCRWKRRSREGRTREHRSRRTESHARPREPRPPRYHARRRLCRTRHITRLSRLDHAVDRSSVVQGKQLPIRVAIVVLRHIKKKHTPTTTSSNPALIFDND